MTKQITVTFEFEPETELVSNLKCFVDGIENKKPTTKRKSPEKKEKVVELEDSAIVTLEDNKLVLNNKAVSDLGIKYQDRVLIIYEGNSKNKYPLIGSDLAFDQEGSGNKITKTNTVSYRGNANKILAEFGTSFNLIPHKEGIFKMESLTTPKIVQEELFKDPTYDNIVNSIKDEDIVLFTKDDEIEVEELAFKL